MSERKVLTKYYPPDFDPSKITRTKKAPGQAGPKTQTVRLMAPFSMKCTQCGEYIYKGRKFNARKETSDEKYYNITIYRFYIRCTRCSGEITFKTDPQSMDYICERGAKRNFEPWRNANGDNPAKIETEEERLDRLEAEEAEQGGAMEQLEAKVVDAKREMDIADALDEIRTRNARIQRAEGKGEVDAALEIAEQERKKVEAEQRRQEQEDEEAARRAFADRRAVEQADSGELNFDDAVKELAQDPKAVPSQTSDGTHAATKQQHGMPPPPSFKKVAKKKKDSTNMFGLKKKAPLV